MGRQEKILDYGITYALIVLKEHEDGETLSLKHLVTFNHMPTFNKIDEVKEEMKQNPKINTKDSLVGDYRILIMHISDIQDDTILTVIENISAGDPDAISIIGGN